MARHATLPNSRVRLDKTKNPTSFAPLPTSDIYPKSSTGNNDWAIESPGKDGGEDYRNRAELAWSAAGGKEAAEASVRYLLPSKFLLSAIHTVTRL